MTDPTTPSPSGRGDTGRELPGLRRALAIVREMNATGCTSLDIEADLATEVDQAALAPAGGTAGGAPIAWRVRFHDRQSWSYMALEPDPAFFAEVVPLYAAPPPGPAPSGEALVAYLLRQWAWSKETFGPALRTKGVVQHIRKELVEIEAKPHDLAEWVDVIILAMDGFWRHGGKPEDLLPAMQAKQDKNFARTWPDWRTMGDDQAIEHDRSGEAAPSPDAPAAPAGGLAGVEAAQVWRPMSEEPIGRPITARMRLGDGSWWYARVRVWRHEDGDGGRFGDHGYELLHYNGDVTMGRFYGPFDSWCEINAVLDAVRALQAPRADVAGLIDNLTWLAFEGLTAEHPNVVKARATLDAAIAALPGGSAGGAGGAVPENLRRLFDHAIRAGDPSPEWREFSAAAVRFAEVLCRADRARIAAEGRARPASCTGEGDRG